VRRRSLVASLLGIILIAVVALSATLIAGRSPRLGLDLRGGLSVVLQPHGKVDKAELNAAVNIIDRRIGLGVANSSVERQGNDVVIELPGIKDSQQALKEIGTTAQLFFRPVDCTAPAYVKPAKSSTSTTVPKTTSTTAKTTSTTAKATTSPTKSTTTTHKAADAPSGGAGPANGALTAMVTEAATSSTTAAVATTVPSSATTVPSSPTTISSSSTTAASATTVPSSSSTTAPASTSTTTPAATKSTDAFAYLDAFCGSGELPAGVPTTAEATPSTNPNNDLATNTVIVPQSSTSGYSGGTRWILGPADLSGEIVKTASSALDTTNGEYVVNVTLTSSGLKKFNAIAKIRNQYVTSSSTTDPKSEEAIELDGVLESAPTINDATFTGPIQISGSFTAKQASALATELRYGSLPVRFTSGSINTVSATLGHSSLIAGLLAGLGGLVLVMLYMILYYRALGLVVILGLGVGGAILFSVLTELSYTSSLALTLSGIVGVIVSIGITVDSYVVYFERLKDEVRQGRTVRASVERGFTRAFKTVLTADLVSFMAALILYLFTVGDVKGFAFTLGLSTLLDVATAYLFIRPIVILLGRRRTTSETRFLGIGRGLGADRPEGTG
jgi:preprotein translocase subunit SecD